MECQFADNAALLATTRAGAERALQCYIEVAGDLGLTVSIPKTKIMARGRLVQPGDEGPIRIDDNNCVESVSEFQYLGSMVERSGRVDTDVERSLKGIWLSSSSSVQGQGSDGTDKEKCLPGLRAVGLVVWLRVLDSPQKAQEET